MGRIIEKCEHCGAELEYELNAQEVTCEYCGYKKIVNNTLNNKPNNIISNMEERPLINNQPVFHNKPKKKKKKNVKKTILSIFFILVIIASCIIFYLDYQKKEEQPSIFDPLPSEIEVKEEDKKETSIESALINLAPDVDLNAERAKYNNNDIIGRLEVPDLINVLVVKGTDNDYYLKHSVKKTKDVRGTEFLDYRLTPTSKQLNIYGHNTRDSRIKVAFIKLEQLLNKEFFDNNQYIVFQHDGGKNIYKIIAIKEVYNTSKEHMGVNYTGNDFVEHVRRMTTGEGVVNSRDIPYDENSEIIVLQTCSHHWDNALYTVIGIKIQ